MREGEWNFVFVCTMLVLMLWVNDSLSCTNFIVTPAASKTGASIVSYSADSHTLYGAIRHFPAGNHPPESVVRIVDWDSEEFLGYVKQVPHTYNVLSNMNEHQVIITETTFEGREELIEKNKDDVLDYANLMWLALQRSKTAVEAIDVMEALIEEYGYASEGESITIADPNEVFIFEVIGKGKEEKGAVWVAVKIPDGSVSAHANHARIRQFPLNSPSTCRYSKDVISFARSRGFFTGKDSEFSFSDVYNPCEFEGVRWAEARVWDFFQRVKSGFGSKYLSYVQGKELSGRMPLSIVPDSKLGVEDIREFMRSHFEGTFFDMRNGFGSFPFGLPYRWRPLSFRSSKNSKNQEGVYVNERAVATQQTGFVVIGETTNEFPREFGVMWFGVDDTAGAVYTPVFVCSKKVAESYSYEQEESGILQFNYGSVFWIFNLMNHLSYSRYELIYPEIRERIEILEDGYEISVNQVKKQVLETYKNEGVEKAVGMLSNYSVLMQELTFDQWRRFHGELFAKFLDGDVKYSQIGTNVPNVTYPGYPQEWYDMIASETGDRYFEKYSNEGIIEKKKQKHYKGWLIFISILYFFFTLICGVVCAYGFGVFR